MDGFIDLIADIVHANGLTRANLLRLGQPVSLPGYFSPTQSWDLVVVNEGRLIAAMKLDSVPGELLAKHAGIGCREVLSMAMELRAANRGHIFGENRQPFVGYLAEIPE
jgi:restriction endonuclease XhoI-like protein